MRLVRLFRESVENGIYGSDLEGVARVEDRIAKLTLGNAGCKEPLVRA